MDANFLQSLTSKSPPPTIHVLAKPSTTTPPTQILLPRRQQSLRLSSTNGTSSDTSGNDVPPPAPPVAPPRITPPNTAEIRFKRRSRRRSRQLENDGASPMKAQASAPAPKKWEDMTLTEKATELYVGEKGLLFWLNKFAYASIFAVIGGWILFRFVGPALNLYQLDSPPLSPTSMFKGS